MKLNLFKPEDFEHVAKREIWEFANARLNEYIESLDVVYFEKDKAGSKLRNIGVELTSFDTHTARLICLEPIEKKECVEHYPIVESMQVGGTDTAMSLLMGCSIVCSRCKKRLKVAKWECDERFE